MHYVNIIKKRKFIDGLLYRRYFVDSSGNEIGVPSGVSFKKSGQVPYVTNHNLAKKNTNVRTCMLPYSDQTSQEDALKTIILGIAKMTQGENRTACVERHESKPRQKTEVYDITGIDNSKLPAGISLFYRSVRGTKTFQANASYYDEEKKLFFIKVFYCGTINTWKTYLPNRLEEAIRFREASLVHYRKHTTPGNQSQSCS